MRLANKIGLVTGAGSGIGRAIARRFAAEGVSLVLSDISEAGLQATAAMISESGGHSISVLGDVSARADADRMMQAAVEHWGHLDVVVNNAGITGSRLATLAHLTPDEEWDRVMAVNVTGVFRVSSAAIRQMLTQDGGTIINIASVAGVVPFPARAAYDASKGAVIAFTRSLALDYAANHIRANAICPGMVETGMTRWRLDIPELHQQVLDMTPWGRVGHAEHIASAALYPSAGGRRFVTRPLFG